MFQGIGPVDEAPLSTTQTGAPRNSNKRPPAEPEREEDLSSISSLDSEVDLPFVERPCCEALMASLGLAPAPPAAADDDAVERGPFPPPAVFETRAKAIQRAAPLGDARNPLCAPPPPSAPLGSQQRRTVDSRTTTEGSEDAATSSTSSSDESNRERRRLPEEVGQPQSNNDGKPVLASAR